MQNVIRRAFDAREDIELTGVASGALSALASIREQSPDLVVIDSYLPYAEVKELVASVRREERAVRFLALADSREQIRRLNAAGVDFILRTMDFPAKVGLALEKMGSSPGDWPKVEQIPE